MVVKPSNVEAIFYAALQKESPAERGAYLDEVCCTDADLRADVESLLTAHQNVGEFFKHPGIPTGLSEPCAELAESPGTIIGRFKLLQLIGEGASGRFTWPSSESRSCARSP